MKDVIPTAGVLIIVNNKVLLVRHTEETEHITDTYGLPAGKIKENESEKDTAIRKLKEETGLVTSKKHLTPIPTIYKADIKRKTKDKVFSLKVFLCSKYTGKLAASKGEIPEWVSFSDVKTLNLLPNIKEVISEGIKIEVPDIVN